MAFNLFGSLMPKEDSFIELFQEQARMISSAARAFQAIVHDGGTDIEAKLAALGRIEEEADAAARRIFIAGNRTFNAPLDRENILQLAHELDDVVDLIEDTAKQIRLFEMHGFCDGMRSMADAIVRSAGEVERLLPLLAEITKQHRSITRICQAIGRIEEEADAAFDAGLIQLRAQLRRGETDTVGYLDQKEIYEGLEAVMDKFDDVANVVQTITAKHV